MSLHEHCYLIHEGSLLLPTGCQDRTANIFVPTATALSPFNFNIGRDTMAPEETLADYVKRQIAVMKENIPGYRLLGRSDARLGSGDAVIAGQRIDACYRSANHTLHQRQAAFPFPDRRVLIVSASGAGAFDEPANAAWAGWLASFIPRSAMEGASPQASAPPHAGKD